MKNLIFILIFFSHSCFGQLTPFVTEGNTWTTMASPEPNVTYLQIWEIYGDTIVNSISYKKISQYGLGVQYPGLQGMVRQVGKKVYYRPVFPSESILCDTSEVLLYDFSPINGDSLRFQRCTNNNSELIAAPLDTSKESGQCFGENRTYIHHAYAFGGVYEEVGYAQSPLFPLNILYEAIPFLVCFNGYGQGPGVVDCISDVSKQIMSEKDFWVENPVLSKTLRMSVTRPISDAGYWVVLTNAQGQKVFDNKIVKNETWFEENLEVAPGIYFLTLYTKNGIGSKKILVAD
jgi:hypothetical protein